MQRPDAPKGAHDEAHAGQVGLANSPTAGGSEREGSRPHGIGTAGRTLVSPLGTPEFRRLATGRLLSQLADWLLAAALVGWTYHHTGSTTAVAALLLIRLLPPLLGGGFAVVLVDRFAHRRLLPVLEALRAGAAGIALCGLTLHLLPLAAVAVFVVGALGPLGGVTVRTLVPRVVDSAGLAAANALLALASEIALVVGALGAGVALATSSTTGAVAGVVVLALAASAAYAGIRPASAAPPERRRPAAATAGWQNGLTHVRERRVLVFAIASFATATVATGLVNATLPRLLSERGLGAGGYGFGLAALATGLMVGEIAAGLLPASRISLRGMGAALVAMGGMLVALGFSGGATAALVFLALAGIGDGASDVLFQTLAQRTAGPEYLGRVLGIAQTAMTGTMLGAVAIAPVLNAVAGPSVVVVTAGSILLIAALLALRPVGAVAVRVDVAFAARAPGVGSPARSAW